VVGDEGGVFSGETYPELMLFVQPEPIEENAVGEEQEEEQEALGEESEWKDCVGDAPTYIGGVDPLIGLGRSAVYCSSRPSRGLPANERITCAISHS